jgi:CBS domain-containing protein
MFDRPIKSIMERDRFLTAPPQTTVSDAARLMATRNAGAVLVVANESLVGIFTERDIVFRVIAKDLDPATTHLDTVMTRRRSRWTPAGPTVTRCC